MYFYYGNNLNAGRIWAIHSGTPNDWPQHKLNYITSLKWIDSTKTSTLNVYWEGFHYEKYYKKADISIVLSKKYINHSNKDIKFLTEDIHQFTRLKFNDCIFRINEGGKVERLGLISNVIVKEGESLGIEMTIRWDEKIEKSDLNDLGPFNSKLRIQKIPIRIIRKSGDSLTKNLNIRFKQTKVDRLIEMQDDLEHFDLESKTLKDETLKISPPLMTKYLEELMSDVPQKEDKGGKIGVYYSTNRNRICNQLNNTIEYGDELTNELKYGICEISIPRGHIRGEIERPMHILQFELTENSDRHVVVTHTGEMDENNFIVSLSKDVEASKGKSAFIFVHGYNTTFEEAARRASQIAYDVPFNGIPAFFSWPSGGRKLDYLKDDSNARSSLSLLAKFIEQFLLLQGIQKLHIIAHSMGSLLVTTTLNALSDKSTLSQKLQIINQIVLGAPDISQDEFRNNILPKLLNTGLQRTIYASDKDKALDISEKIRRGLPRLGEAGKSLFVTRGIDTVDASNVPSRGNNHSYIFEEKELLYDLHFLLNLGLAPIDRRLSPRTKDNLPYWLFPR